MELVVFLVSLFGFLALGIPIAIVLVLCSMVLMYYGGMWDSMFVMIIPQSMLDGANNYPLMAIPFFVFAGEIMTEGGLSKRVVKLAQLIIGRVRGGLGYAAIVSSVIFAGLMGSSVGEAAALGSLLLPMMAQAGYKPGRAGGVIASGAILGPIIPPSTNFILLGATVGLSITKLFMIGLVPGLIIGLCLMVTWFFIVRIDGYKEKIEFKKGEASKIVRDAMPAFMMPVLLLGGIRFGVFTPTEGGAFACVYAIAVCTLYYRELTFKGLLAVSARAARTTSVVMLIVATATAVGWFITSAQIPMQVAELFQPLVDSPILLLLSINVFLFLAGMVMDLTPNVLIFAPVFYPLIQQAGIDLALHLGVQVGRGAVEGDALHKGVDGGAALGPGHAGLLQKGRALQCHGPRGVGHGADTDLGRDLLQRGAGAAPGKALAQGIQQGFVRRGRGGRFRRGGRLGRRQYLYSKRYAGGQVVGQ